MSSEDPESELPGGGVEELGDGVVVGDPVVDGLAEDKEDQPAKGLVDLVAAEEAFASGGKPSALWLWSLRGVALLGLGLALALQALSSGLQSHLPGCTLGGLDCTSVLRSPYARWLGIPNTALAVGLFGLILLLSLGQGRARPPRCWKLQVACSGAALGAALWFLGLMGMHMQAFCLYCLGVHACSVTLALLVFGRAPWRELRLAPWLLFSALGVGVLVGGQLIFPPSCHKLRQLPEPLTFEREEIPWLGAREGARQGFWFFDYTCSHCREAYPQVKQFLEAKGQDLSLGVMPVPLSHHCNQHMKYTGIKQKDACSYAVLALRVWRADPEAFPAFHAFLFTGEEPPGKKAARAKAVKLVGAERLREVVSDPMISKSLVHNMDLLAKIKSGLPLIVFGKDGVSGHLEQELLSSFFAGTLEGLKAKAGEAGQTPGR